MKHWAIVLMVVITMLSGCGKENTSYKQISMAKAQTTFSEDIVLVDVRTKEEFEAGHIPNAINVPLDDILNENIETLEDKNQTYYIYCRSGNRSKQASEKLASLGYNAIIEIGGIIDYTGEIDE